MFGDDFEVVTWDRRLKFALRRVVHAPAIRALLQGLESDAVGAGLLRHRPRVFYPVVSHLLDRRLDAAQRCEATLASLGAMRRVLGGNQALQGMINRGLRLFELADGTAIELSLNGVSFHEGLWQLGLIDATGVRTYSLGFGFLSSRTLLVGNVQGPSLGTQGLAMIRRATGSAEGLRPPYLLLHVLRTLVRHWGIEDLRGIDPEHHVKGRWNLRGTRLQFDYRAFWQESGATRRGDGHWQLPLLLAMRGPDDVPSKRRAMYRRRQALLARIEAHIERACALLAGRR
jgi:uncharacterized protein VirK/YbjX